MGVNSVVLVFYVPEFTFTTCYYMEKKKIFDQIHMSYLMTKPTKWHVCPAKTQNRVWSESSLSAWRKLRYLATHWATAKTDQTGRIPRMVWVFAGRTVILLVLSWGGSYWYILSYKFQAFVWLCRDQAVWGIYRNRLRDFRTPIISSRVAFFNRFCPLLRTFRPLNSVQPHRQVIRCPSVEKARPC